MEVKMFKGGFKGKLLRLNLTNHSYSVEEIKTELQELLVGGRGVAAKYYYDEIAPGTKPLSAENKLIFMTGPLTGAPVYASTKFQLAMCSPLSGKYCCSNSGGNFGPHLKFSGFDGVIVEGKSEKPVFVTIFDDKVEFHDAGELWGKTTGETDEFLREKYDDKKLSVMSIGPGSENLVRYGCIQVDTRSFGRGGGGAVMGYKNLKAIAVKGTGEIPLAKPRELNEYIKANMRKLRDSKPDHTKYGTAQYTEVINEFGCYPNDSFTKGYMHDAEPIFATTMVRDYKIRNAACYRCPIACSQVCEVKDGPYKGAISDPEFETVGSFGGQCGVRDFEPIIAACELADEYSMDAMQVGTVIAAAMEMYEDGLLTKEDTDGIELNFGNGKAMVEFVKKIAYRDGKLANFLANSYYEMVEECPKTERYLHHVKGMAFAAYDPRGFYGMALAYGTSSRGACHNVGGWTIRAELTSPKLDRFAFDGKGELVKSIQDTRAYVDSVGICTVVRSGLGFTEEPFANVLEMVTGYEYTPKLMDIADVIYDFERVILNREGITRKDDYLPNRFYEEALPEGDAAGKILARENYDLMLDDYYKARGWDSNGVITEEKIKNSNLEMILKM
jgi:aldehyde:ferredoxin oxidoreductase